MEIRNELLQTKSKQRAEHLAKRIIEDDLTRELANIISENDTRVAVWAGMVLSKCADVNADIFKKDISLFLRLLYNKSLHQAYKRNILRLFTKMIIPKKAHGPIASLCFQFLNSTAESIAVKVFSMTLLGKMAHVYPELQEEFKATIEYQMKYSSPGFISRAKKELKRLG
jgi:hypothetical protein